MPATPTGSSAAESPTSDPENSSAAADSGSPNAATKTSTASNTNGLPNELDTTKLSPRSQAILTKIVEPMTRGYRETEIAEMLGRTPSWVSERLSELRTEIQLQNGLFPPLTDDEYKALKTSIEQQGIRVPILLDENEDVIDGRHRLRIAGELDIDVPVIVLTGLTDEEKQELEYELNAARRQLSRGQKQVMVRYQLLVDANRSDRRIATICGVHHETVASIRRQLEAEQATKHAVENAPDDADTVETAHGTVELTKGADVAETATRQPFVNRVDSTGRVQPASKPREKQESIIECPHCGENIVGARWT